VFSPDVLEGGQKLQQQFFKLQQNLRNLYSKILQDSQVSGIAVMKT